MYNSNFLIENSYLTEIDFGAAAPGAGQQVFFKDYPILTARSGEQKLFTGVEVYYSDVLAVSPNGVPLISLTQLSALTLTIACGSDEKLYKVPVTNLCTFLVGGFIRKLNMLPVTITKCYVTVNSAIIPANTSVCFNWYYEKKKI